MSNEKMKKRIFIALVLVIVAALSIAAFSRHAYVVPVLMYHSIDYNDKMTKLSVSPESFERQMEFFYRNHYNIVPLNKIIPYIKKKARVPPKTAAITFDDGYYNNYKYAYPVLKKYNIPATIFVITSKVGKPGYVGWPELKEIADSGVITIGSHTNFHLWLPDLPQSKMKDEIVGSKRIIEDKLGKKVDTFCYPIGAFNKNVENAVRDAGYSCAVTTNPGRFKRTDDIYAIKRIKISRTSDNLFVFWVETSGYYTWMKEHRDE